jgi:hypothetical protein
VLAVILVGCVVSVGGLVGFADYVGALDTKATWRAGTAPTQLPPAHDAPATEWTSWARRTLGEELSAQASALLAGDEQGYLTAVDSANSRLVSEHRRWFSSLRDMGLGVWTESVSGGLTSTGSYQWSTDVKISYCFGAPTCDSVDLPVATTWELKDERLVMVELKPSIPDWNGPRPWEVDELTVARGKRVIVASTSENAWRLPDAVRAADRAAAVADRFAKWNQPPSRYVIFLASPSQWKKWYGHEQPDWAAAWAVPVSNTVTEVMVRAQVVRQSGLENLLRHELTHVSSLAGDRNGAGRTTWWLVEGIAEYAMMSGRPVSDYDALGATHAFVHGTWDGNPAVEAPGANASLEEAGGRYGVAFLCVRRMATKYGEDKMLTFWGRMVHDADTLDEAAHGVYGVPWSTVRSDCVSFIRSSAG